MRYAVYETFAGKTWECGRFKLALHAESFVALMQQSFPYARYVVKKRRVGFLERFLSQFSQ